MTKQIVKDKNNKTLGVMLFLTEEEANIFEDYIDDMANYESDLLAIKEAKEDNEFLDGESVFRETMNGNYVYEKKTKQEKNETDSKNGTGNC